MSDKIKIKISTIVGVILALIFILWLVWPNDNSTGYPISKDNIQSDDSLDTTIKNPTLYFYDNKTNCPLSGKIYSGDTLIGEVTRGEIELTPEDYKRINSNETFYILGETDSCFEKNSGLPFYRGWTFVDWEYLFETGESEDFMLDLNPRWPIFNEEMQGFVRPYEAQSYLDSQIRRYLKGNIEEDLAKINEYSIRYRSDSLLFNEPEYWQTPAETLKKGHGDCEDWAVTTLSIMREYNSSVECYNAIWDTHVSIMCFLGNKLIIYDQDNIKSGKNLRLEGLIESEKKIEVRKLVYSYLDYYGLGTEDNNIHALFNDKSLIEFEDTEDFIDWVIRR